MQREPQDDPHYDEYREESNRLRYEREQSRRRIVYDPRDPDYISPDEEGEELNAYPCY